MAQKKSKETKDYPTLLKRFEDDIQCDCHARWISFDRSDAQKELFRRGKEALRPILDYLREAEVKTDCFLNGDEFELSWARLFDRLEKKVDPDKTGPSDLRDLPGWVKWAEKFA